MPDTRFVIRAFGFLSILLLPFLWSPVGFTQDGEGASTSPFAGLRFREHYLKRLASASQETRFSAARPPRYAASTFVECEIARINK